ncbi:hypothetical protein E1J61_24020 [Cupriavidus sp. L7L]|nr:hypothetical protein E1J61_24020 [Cupriavidus sp. L7L]
MVRWNLAHWQWPNHLQDELRGRSMPTMLGRLAGVLLLLGMVAALGGCAAGGADEQESGITAYGTLDVGISRTSR